jgi:hypothetical protein
VNNIGSFPRLAEVHVGWLEGYGDGRHDDEYKVRELRLDSGNVEYKAAHVGLSSQNNYLVKWILEAFINLIRSKTNV